MTLTALLTQHFTLRHASDGSTDAYGVATRTYPDSGSDLYGYLEPAAETEQLVGAETFATTFRLFVEPDAGITERDQITDDGRVFEVLEVLPFFNPRTRQQHHIECRLVHTEG